MSPSRNPQNDPSWHLSLTQRRELLRQRRDELAGWRDRFSQPLPHWTFTPAGGTPRPLALGEPWPEVDQAVAGGPALLTSSFSVPEAWRGLPVELELDLGGEGLVTLSGGVSGGLNPYHRRFPVTAPPGEEVEVRVEAVPKGLFGTRNPSPRVGVARLLVAEPAVRALVLDLDVLLETAAELEGHDAVPGLLAAAERALSGRPWPSATPEYLARLEGGVGGWSAADLWNVPGDPPAPTPLAGEMLEGLQSARSALRESLERLRADFPPAGSLALSGHAHLDLGWLWPVAETRRKGRRTFETVLNLMDRFPDFTFNQSSAQLYAWTQQEHPELFERVRQRVREGRWEALGGMWVEPDGQMPGGESWARQLLYGQRYFRETLGRPSTVAWLPDTFGFTPALPGLLRSAGISGFFTTKLSWNETTQFPHDLFLWEGQDGSRVLAHCFTNVARGDPGLGSYNGDLSPAHLGSVWGASRGKGLAAWGERRPESLFTYGYGDGGGGPSPEMLERFERLRDYPASPRLRHSRVDDFFAELPQDGLPLWVGELYLELHRGTLSSNARTKKGNREAEHRLYEAEALSVLAAGRGHPSAAGELERLWKTLLLQQFHDILPGSGIREVNSVAEEALAGVVEGATRLRDEAHAALTEPQEGAFTVTNVALWERPLRALLPVAGGRVSGPGGRELPSQEVEGGLLVSAPGLTVPPLGALTLRVEPGTGSRTPPGAEVEESGGAVTLRTPELEASFSVGGDLTGLLDRLAGREVLGPRGHRLVALRDLPRAWEAWDVNPDTQDQDAGEELPAGQLEVLERGPLRVGVRVTRRWRDSSVTQTFSLTAGSRRLDIRTELDWHERRTLLKAFVDLAVLTRSCTYETAFGALERPTHRNTPFDAARFEVCGHRFADLSEHGYGVSLLNDGRYGHSALGSTLGLTLVRGPVFPDPLADEGPHAFCYALYPHRGGWAAGGTLAEALDLNSPLLVTPGRATLPGWLRLGGMSVALGALKHGEDGEGAVLRVYEPHGGRGTLTLELPPGMTAKRGDLLEDPLPGGPGLRVTGEGRVELDLGPFEVATLLLGTRPG